MSFQGNLQDIPLPDILQLLAGQERSGVLTLRRGKEEVRISISEDGKAVSANANIRPLDERLGAKLVSTLKLSQSDLELTLARTRESGISLGHLLVASGQVPAEEVCRAATLEFRQMLYDVLCWKSGSYAFERRKLDCDRDLINPVGFQAFLMDGMRMIDEWPMIERRTGRRQLILHKAPLASKTAVEPDSDLELSDLESEIYERVDGRATIQQIVDSSMHMGFDVCRALYDLCERELIFPGYEGRLEDVGVGELLYAILRSQHSGLLELRHAGKLRSISFLEGRIFAAQSSDPDDGIGPYLLACSVLSRGELRAALEASSSPEQLGEWLVSSGKLGRQELQAHAIEQMSAVARSLLSWTEGRYLYRPGCSAGSSVGLEPRTARIILEGIRSVDRWSQLERAVGADGTVYRRAAAPSLEALEQLPDELRKRFDLFEHGLTVDQACSRLGMPELGVYQMLWGWSVVGLLDRDELPRKTAALLAALSGAPAVGPIEEVSVDTAYEAPEAGPAAEPAELACDVDLGSALAELAARSATLRSQLPTDDPQAVEEPPGPVEFEEEDLAPELPDEASPPKQRVPPSNAVP